MNDFNVPKLRFPVFCKEYDEYEKVYKGYNMLKSNMENWKKIIERDIIELTLPADKVLFDFFGQSKLISSEKYIEAARKRYIAGDPPGKKDSFGDAINWLCLLDIVPDNEDLYFISADNDYSSVYNNDIFDVYLKNEWKEKKGSEILYYRSLVNFLNKHIKDVELQAEKEKQLLVEKLRYSSSFEQTHGIISMLNRYETWTMPQIESMCYSLLCNSQVEWIAHDDDVHRFYRRLLDKVDLNMLDDSSDIKKAYYQICEIEESNDETEDEYVELFS